MGMSHARLVKPEKMKNYLIKTLVFMRLPVIKVGSTCFDWL